MAIKQNEVVRGLTTPIPDTLAVVRITKAEKKISQSSGNPMIQFDVEIAAPAQIEFAGKTIQIGGQSGQLYGLLDTSKPTHFDRFYSALCRGGLDPREVQTEHLGDDEIFCDDKPEALKCFVDKYMQMTVSSESTIAMRNPTPEERKAGVKPQPLKGPDGKEIVKGYRLKLDWANVVGPAEKPEDDPFA